MSIEITMKNSKVEGKVSILNDAVISSSEATKVDIQNMDYGCDIELLNNYLSTPTNIESLSGYLEKVSEKNEDGSLSKEEIQELRKIVLESKRDPKKTGSFVKEFLLKFSTGTASAILTEWIKQHVN